MAKAPLITLKAGVCDFDVMHPEIKTGIMKYTNSLLDLLTSTKGYTKTHPWLSLPL
jgi:hypothetical protein